MRSTSNASVGATPTPPEKKGLLPDFEGAIAIAIAGLLAIAYVMMRRKR